MEELSDLPESCAWEAHNSVLEKRVLRTDLVTSDSHLGLVGPGSLASKCWGTGRSEPENKSVKLGKKRQESVLNALS